MALEVNAQVGLRQRKKIATAQALEQAALRLFAERGFENVTVEDVAAAVGVSSRSFFRYFRSKDDVVLRPFGELRTVLAEALAAQSPDEPALTALRNGVSALAARLEELRPLLRQRVKIATSAPALVARAQELRDVWRRMLLDEAARRLDADPATDLRPHAAAAWAMAGLSAARELWEHGRTRRDLPSLVADAYDLLSRDVASHFAAPRPSPDARATGRR